MEENQRKPTRQELKEWLKTINTLFPGFGEHYEDEHTSMWTFKSEGERTINISCGDGGAALIKEEMAKEIQKMLNDTMYYTPKVEELRIGYECEIRAPKYEGQKFIVDEDQMQYAAIAIRGGFLFTPYLTKEQIEAEGWSEITNESFYKGMLTLEKENGHTFYCAIRKNKNLLISQYIPSDPNELWSMSMKSTVYDGKCPSINEFRTICKLIGV